MEKEKISSRIDNVKLELGALESSAKLLSFSLAESSSPIPTEEVSGIFALFLPALKSVWDELSDISETLTKKGE